ncbi:MAG: Very short patch repair protein [Actinomycetota bacterium]
MRPPTKAVSERMRAVKTSGTAPEIAAARVLRRMSMRFRRQVRNLPGTPDFLLLDHDIAVFVHGCFWHGCPRCFRGTKRNAAWWREKLDRNRRRDRRKARQLRQCGYGVVQLWEHDSPERIERRIRFATAGARRASHRLSR